MCCPRVLRLGCACMSDGTGVGMPIGLFLPCTRPVSVFLWGPCVFGALWGVRLFGQGHTGVQSSLLPPIVGKDGLSPKGWSSWAPGLGGWALGALLPSEPGSPALAARAAVQAGPCGRRL